MDTSITSLDEESQVISLKIGLMRTQYSEMDSIGKK